MKLIIELKETPRGDVEFVLESKDMETATMKEAVYAQNIRHLLTKCVPVIGKALGAQAAVLSKGDPSKQ